MPEIMQPSEQAIINALNGELNRANDNRIYLMAVLAELQQENINLKAQLSEFTSSEEPAEEVSSG